MFGRQNPQEVDPQRGGECDPDLSLRAARAHLNLGECREAVECALMALDASESYRDWHLAAAIVSRARAAGYHHESRRQATVWISNSHTVVQFGPLLGVAALRMGLDLQVLVGDYGQYRQEILDPNSALYAARPDYVVLAVHAGDLLLPDFADSSAAAVSSELERWTALWRSLGAHGSSRILMHNFVLPSDGPFGHLSTRLDGARDAMVRELNRRLGQEAGDRVLLVDTERLASAFGKSRWLSPKYWHLSKQAFAHDALPTLARHTAAVMAGDLGLGKKCIAVDLDNTLWGGIVGEEGVDGIRIGPNDPEGEAFQAFQRHLKSLQTRGILLAVCSKNNPADAREVFEKRPEMALKLQDFAAFEANWDDKATNLRRIADVLGIGLDSIVFIDDNPAERELVRHLVPQVETLRLPSDPADYVTAVASAPLFEISSYTAEDRARSDLYRSRAQFALLSRSASSLDDFLDTLQMIATAEPVSGRNVARTAQLLGKSNQFNLTTQRYGADRLTMLAEDPSYVLLTFGLSDRLADHGLIGVIGGRLDGAAIEVDVFAMSCRVIGRTMENFMLDALIEAARDRLCSTVRGLFIPTQKNMMVRDLYPRLGFDVEEGSGPQLAFTLPLHRWLHAPRFIARRRPSPERGISSELIDVG